MKPTKHWIYTVIPVFRPEEHIIQVAEQASWYSDRVYVIRNSDTPDYPTLTEYAHVTVAAAIGVELRREAYLTARLKSHDEPEARPVAFVYLEASQIISDPHIVRAAIEQNPGKILTAERFFMWDDEHYRNDGYYYPQRLPVAGDNEVIGHSRMVGWPSEQHTAPGHYYTDLSRHIEAPFHIQDLRFLDHQRRIADGTPSLRKYEGRILV